MKATRKFFMSLNGKYKSDEAEFEFNGGFARIQKEKNRDIFHNEIKEKYPGARILEVSTNRKIKSLGKN